MHSWFYYRTRQRQFTNLRSWIQFKAYPRQQKTAAISPFLWNLFYGLNIFFFKKMAKVENVVMLHTLE